ncbi:MAG TPA: hypothetical protein VGL62_12025, partial [Vicinamibacterales bacterium]
ATDDWPFLYMRDRTLPEHYAVVLLMILILSAAAVGLAMRAQPPAGGTAARTRWSWQFFLLGAGFMLLETKSIIQFALLWGSTWFVASLAIASVLTMALIANFIVDHREIRGGIVVGVVLLALLVVNYFLPIGRVTFASLTAESIFYAALEFSPILCAGLLFGSAIKRSPSVGSDYGVNLLGAMLGGVAEYLSLIIGFRLLLLVIALCYIGAVVARQLETEHAAPAAAELS